MKLLTRLMTSLLIASLVAGGSCLKPIEVATVDFCQVATETGLPFKYRQAEIDARQGFATNLRKEIVLNEAQKELCPEAEE